MSFQSPEYEVLDLRRTVKMNAGYISFLEKEKYSLLDQISNLKYSIDLCNKENRDLLEKLDKASKIVGELFLQKMPFEPSEVIDLLKP